ncbi:hypothetical protein BH23CHL2_BH23CHL2_17280 [soil metagenome]
MALPPQRDPGSERSHLAGTSAALSIAVVGVVMLILVLGSVLILQGWGSDDDSPTPIPSPVGTSELVSGVPTATEPEAGNGTPEETDATAADGASTVTPSPTGTIPTPTESDAGPSPTESAPTEPEPTATATEPDQPEPTATDEPEPTALPLEGAFGFLPPAQLPSGGVSTTLELEYQLAMSLESLPSVGTVYRIVWPVYTLEEVQAARDRLALQAPVIEEGIGVYRVESDRGTLFVSPTEIVFRVAGFNDSTGMPADETAVAAARDWVDLSGFILSPMDSGEIVGRDDDLERIVVKFRPVSPQPNLAPNPSATVTVGSGGIVLEARIAWPADLEASEYGYSNALDIWREIQNGQGFLEADITSVFATGQLSGTATISDYSTAYTLAGNPNTGHFLVPLITFHGTARIDQTGDEIPVFVSIPVVYFEEGTAG